MTGGNEEPDWRGFALPVLLQRLPPILASLILSALHALWHLPLMGRYNGFLPTPADVLGGFGDYMLLRGLVYWTIALVLLIATKGTLGWDSTQIYTEKAREQRVALG